MYVIFHFTTFLDNAGSMTGSGHTVRDRPNEILAAREGIAEILRVDVNDIITARDPDELVAITRGSRQRNTCAWYAIGDQNGSLVAEPFEVSNQVDEGSLRGSLNDSITHFGANKVIRYHSLFAMSPDPVENPRSDAEAVDTAMIRTERNQKKENPYGVITYALAVASLMTVRPNTSMESSPLASDNRLSGERPSSNGPRIRRKPRIIHVDLTEGT